MSSETICGSNLYRTWRAGLPTTTEKGFTSRVTNEAAPTIAPWPIVTPFLMNELSPIQTSDPIKVSILQLIG